MRKKIFTCNINANKIIEFANKVVHAVSKWLVKKDMNFNE